MGFMGIKGDRPEGAADGQFCISASAVDCAAVFWQQCLRQGFA